VGFGEEQAQVIKRGRLVEEERLLSGLNRSWSRLNVAITIQ